MKLKKIVSLALAGVLAVSMLAACGDNGNTNNQPEQPEEPTTSGYSTVFANALTGKAAVPGKITMSDNAQLTADLDKAVERLTASSITGNYYGITDVVNFYMYGIGGHSYGNGLKDLQAIADELKGREVNFAFGSVKSGDGEWMLGDFANDPDEDRTVTMLFIVNSAVSANAAVKEVAEDLNENIGALKTTDEKNDMHYNYTGSVSVSTKTLENDHSKGVHIIAVQITRSAEA